MLSYGESDGGLWAAFHREEEYKKRTASNSEDNRLIDITKHEIDAAIKGAHLTATDRISFRNLRAGTRVVPFDLYGPLRVTRVEDAEGAICPSFRRTRMKMPILALFCQSRSRRDKTYQSTVQYDGGDALRDSGGGNFILMPRSTWYPANAHALFAEDRAIFDMTFRYPKAIPLSARVHRQLRMLAKAIFWSRNGPAEN